MPAFPGDLPLQHALAMLQAHCMRRACWLKHLDFGAHTAAGLPDLPICPILEGPFCGSCPPASCCARQSASPRGAEQYERDARRGRVDALLAQRAEIHAGIAASVPMGTMTADFAEQDLAARAGMRALEGNLASERALLREFQADLFTHVRCPRGSERLVRMCELQGP